MKVGLLAYSTNTGLGYQTLEFYQNMKPDKVLIPDLSRYNGMETHHDRYFQPRICDGKPSDEDMEWLVDGMDIVFVCETPLNYHLFEYANRKGVKTVLQYNHEFLDYFNRKDLAKPTVLAAPTLWGAIQVHYKGWAPVDWWPVPVNVKRFEYRHAQKVETFVHIIGRPAAYDRNGTIQFLDAAMQMPEEYNFIVYVQPPDDVQSNAHYQPVKQKLEHAKRILKNRLEIVKNVEDNRDMYKRGQVLVLPRRYGGLCLPMWEAMSAGMPVIMTDVIPNNTILPHDWLVESEIDGHFMARSPITLYTAKHDKLVEKMLFMTEYIEGHSKTARELAERMSWQAQKPIYEARFKDLCELPYMTK